jgi:hypothetical protein
MSDLNSRPFFPRPTVRFSRQAGVLPRVLRVLSRHITHAVGAPYRHATVRSPTLDETCVCLIAAFHGGPN